MPAFAESFSPSEIWDIVHFVQSLRINAHMQELRVAGLAANQEDQARRHLWSNLSQAADAGKISDTVIAEDYKRVPVAKRDGRVHIANIDPNQTKEDSAQ